MNFKCKHLRDFVSIIFICGCSNSNNALPKILIIGDSIPEDISPMLKKTLLVRLNYFNLLSPIINGNIKSCCGGTTQGVNEIDIYLKEKNGILFILILDCMILNILIPLQEKTVKI